MGQVGSNTIGKGYHWGSTLGVEIRILIPSGGLKIQILRVCMITEGARFLVWAIFKFQIAPTRKLMTTSLFSGSVFLRFDRKAFPDWAPTLWQYKGHKSNIKRWVDLFGIKDLKWSPCDGRFRLIVIRTHRPNYNYFQMITPLISSIQFKNLWNNYKRPVTVCHDICPDQHLYAIGCIKNQRWSYKRALCWNIGHVNLAYWPLDVAYINWPIWGHDPRRSVGNWREGLFA